MDKTGRMVIKPQFHIGLPFRHGLAGVSIAGKYGYIDRQGRMVIKPQFRQTWDGFSDDGLAPVEY